MKARHHLILLLLLGATALPAATITYPSGVEHKFSPSTTTPGLNVGSVAVDPSAAANGSLWYNTTTGKLMGRQAGANIELGGSSATGDVTAADNFGTDNRIIRSNGTTKGVQSTGIGIDDNDQISLTIDGASETGISVTASGASARAVTGIASAASGVGLLGQANHASASPLRLQNSAGQAANVTVSAADTVSMANLAVSGTATTGTVAATSLQIGATAVTTSGAELNFVDGVTSAIQTQLDAKQALDTDLTDLADGSLTGSKVGTGISASNVTTATLPAAQLPATAVTPGAYTAANVTVDATGRITAAANGSATGLPLHPAQAVDDAIAGLTNGTDTANVYSTQNHGTSTYIRSATCWADGFDLTAVSPWNSVSAGSWAGTAITPRHIVMANHAHVEAGATMRWITAGNVVVTRTLSSVQQVGSTDIIIGLLSSDLPSTIVPAKLLPADYANYLTLTKFPVGYLTQTEAIYVGDINAPAAGTGPIVAPTNAQRLEFYTVPVSGDSGNPILTFIDGETVVLGCFFTSTTYPFLSSYLTEIAAAITTLGANGHAISLIDLSHHNTDWTEIQGRPVLATVATSGSATDLGAGLIPPARLTGDTPANGEVLVWNTGGATSWESPTAGTVTWDGIGDPAGDGIVDFGGTQQGITSTKDSGVVFGITNSDADAAADTTLFRLLHLDSGDSNVTYLSGYNGSLQADFLFGQTVASIAPPLTLGSTLALTGAAAPTTGAGLLAFDNNAWAASHGAVQFGNGTGTTYLIGVEASDTPSNGQYPRWNTGGTITWETVSGTGDVTAASNFGTDNRLIRADGTSKGVQATGISIDDNDQITLTVDGSSETGLSVTASASSGRGIYGNATGSSGTGVYGVNQTNAGVGTAGVTTVSGGVGLLGNTTHGSGTSLRLLNSGGQAADLNVSGEDTLSIVDLSAANIYASASITTANGAYDATTWNGNTTVPTKDAVRDKIESLGSSTPTIETLTDAATVTPVSSNGGGILTTLSQTTTIANPTGSPTDQQRYTLRIKSTTARTLAWGSQFRFSTDMPAPATTSGSSLTDYLTFIWNAADTKWDVAGKNFGF